MRLFFFLADVESCSYFFPTKDVLSGSSGIIQPRDDGTRVYASEGSAVTLPCVFSAALSPSDTVWEKKELGSQFRAAPRRLLLASSSQSPADKSANLPEVLPEDGGTYRCSGMVKNRRLTRNMKLVVAKSELPRFLSPSSVFFLLFLPAFNSLL